jgi:hypothetical protein
MRKMEAKAQLDIIGVEIKHQMDYEGQSDYIGKFTNTWEPGALVRSQRARNEYPVRYFVSANNVWRNWRTSWDHVPDEDKEATIKKYGSLKSAMFQWAKEDMKRLENLGRTWNYIGVTCLASIRITLGEHMFTVQVYDSLYGVESDSPEGIKEVEKDLVANVQFELIDIGFSLIETEQAFRTIRQVEDYS